MTRTRMIWAAGVLLILAFAGCSGGGDDNDAASNTTAPAAPTTTARPVDTSFTGQNSAQFCALARTYSERSTRVAPNATPAELRTLTREGQTAITQAANAAPAEIKREVEVISSAFNSLVSELEKVNFEVARVPPTAFGSLAAPEFTQATTRFQSYVRTVCGVATG